MREEINKLIMEEDKRNPWTDEELAGRLHVAREYVTQIRRELGIPDSRDRRKQCLLEAAARILQEEPDISERQMTDRLNRQGFSVGKYVVGNCVRQLREARGGEREKTVRPSAAPFRSAPASPANPLPQSAVSTPGTISAPGNPPAPGKPPAPGTVSPPQDAACGGAVPPRSISPSQDTAPSSGAVPPPAASVFARFIGWDGSMSRQIKKAQAAVLYPPNGIHTLIHGPSGVGKSFLAELMYQYARTTGNFKPNMPFYQFNCADYAENPQLLLAQLFGYRKGAFTGATEEKKGIVEQCDGGILFLDEVHRLPPEGQEILFYLMDKGKYRRLGEVEVQRKSQVMVIAATTENPESALLLTFRRRIPMELSIPPVSERPWPEKMALIQDTFMQECQRLKKRLAVPKEVLRRLMRKDYPGNVGELKSVVQVLCAKAFLEHRSEDGEEIPVDEELLADGMEHSMFSVLPAEAEKLCSRDMVFSYDEKPVYAPQRREDGNLYEELGQQYDAMRAKGIASQEIEEILYDRLNSQISRYVKEAGESGFSREELLGIVGENYVQMATDLYTFAAERLPGLSDQMIFPLAIHLHMDQQRLRPGNRREGREIRLENVRETYAAEYEVAAEAAAWAGKKYYVEFTQQEILFLTMYFQKFRREAARKDGKIKVLVVSHGPVASGMLQVANTIMGVRYGESLDFDLSEPAAGMRPAVVRKVREMDEGKGVIVLADMGTLVNVREDLEELPFKTALIGRTDTMMVIECIRRTLWTDDSLEEIVEELDDRRAFRESVRPDHQKKKAVVCLCMTGDGGAVLLKNHLQERLKSCLGDVEILTRGYLEETDAAHIIRKLSRSYRILAVVGTLTVELEDCFFMPYSEALTAEGIKKLRKVIKKTTQFENNCLSQVITEENIHVHSGRLEKEQVIDEAVEIMVRQKAVRPEFLLSVYKREGMMTTFLKGGIAIPHGAPNLVTKSVISVTKLDTPIVWDGVNMADLIFVIALNENSRQIFEQFYSIISDETVISQIRECGDSQEILKILCKST